MGKTTSALLPFSEFAQRAIRSLRNTEKSMGIHTVYSGFMTAAKQYYDTDSASVVAMLKDAVAKKQLDMHFAKGGSVIFLHGEMPERTEASADKVIDQILNGKKK